LWVLVFVVVQKRETRLRVKRACGKPKLPPGLPKDFEQALNLPFAITYGVLN
jgi:hypothetical protein